MPVARFVPPMLLKLVAALPEGERWQYEIKWDGYRGIAVLNRGKAQLISRNEKSMAKRFPSLVDALASLKVSSAVLDGEVVVLDREGKPSFQSLQYFEPEREAGLFYYAFDLMHLDGTDMKAASLSERRLVLQELLARGPDRIRLSSTLEELRNS